MYKINEKLAQAILNYLGRQPYADVWELIGALQNLEKIKTRIKTDKKS